MFRTTYNMCRAMIERLDAAVETWPDALPTIEEFRKLRQQLLEEYNRIEGRTQYCNGIEEAWFQADFIIDCMEDGGTPDVNELDELSSILDYTVRYKEI